MKGSTFSSDNHCQSPPPNPPDFYHSDAHSFFQRFTMVQSPEGRHCDCFEPKALNAKCSTPEFCPVGLAVSPWKLASRLRAMSVGKASQNLLILDTPDQTIDGSNNHIKPRQSYLKPFIYTDPQVSGERMGTYSHHRCATAVHPSARGVIDMPPITRLPCI